VQGAHRWLGGSEMLVARVGVAIARLRERAGHGSRESTVRWTPRKVCWTRARRVRVLVQWCARGTALVTLDSDFAVLWLINARMLSRRTRGKRAKQLNTNGS